MNIPVFKEYFQNLPEDDRYLMVSYLGACITRKGHSLEKLVTLTSNNPTWTSKLISSVGLGNIVAGMGRAPLTAYKTGKDLLR